MVNLWVIRHVGDCFNCVRSNIFIPVVARLHILFSFCFTFFISGGNFSSFVIVVVPVNFIGSTQSP
jgi:hypothetical protein